MLVHVLAVLAPVLLGCAGLVWLGARHVRKSATRPAPIVDAGPPRFVVRVEYADGGANDVYTGPLGARARDVFTAQSSFATRRVTLTDGGERRGFSDYGATR